MAKPTAACLYVLFAFLSGCTHAPQAQAPLPGVAQGPATCPSRSAQVDDAVMAAASLAVDAITLAQPGSWPGLRSLARDGKVRPVLYDDIMRLVAIPGSIGAIKALSQPMLVCQLREEITDLRATVIANELELDPYTEKEFVARIDAYEEVIDLIEASEKPGFQDYGMLIKKIESVQNEPSPQQIARWKREHEDADVERCGRNPTDRDCPDLLEQVEKRDAEIERRRSAKEAQVYMAENFTQNKDGTLRRKTFWEKLVGDDPHP